MENDDDEENSIEEWLDQYQENPSRLKVESALDVLKDDSIYSEKGDEMQSIIFKFEKLYCTEPWNPLKQKDITDFFKAIGSCRSNYLG